MTKVCFFARGIYRSFLRDFRWFWNEMIAEGKRNGKYQYPKNT
jgi:hypothetical protein